MGMNMVPKLCDFGFALPVEKSHQNVLPQRSVEDPLMYCYLTYDDYSRIQKDSNSSVCNQQYDRVNEK